VIRYVDRDTLCRLWYVM